MARIADPGSFTFRAPNPVLQLELVQVPLPPISTTAEIDADGNITVAVSMQATDFPFAFNQNVHGFDISLSGTVTAAGRFVSGRLDPGSGAMSLAGSLFASVTFTATINPGVAYSGTCSIGGSAPADQLRVTVTTDPPGTPYSQQTGTVTLAANLGNPVVCDPALPIPLTFVMGPGGLTIPGAITPILVQGVPVVIGVSPSSGSGFGDDPVTVTGAGFTGATGVWFGAVRAPAMQVNSDSKITAISTPRGAGIVHVTVTTPAGTSATSPADQFSYTPVVTGVGPPGGSAVGGDTVTITGAGFTGVTGVRFGAAAAPAVTVNSDLQITAVSPPGAGPVDVTVTTPAGTSATSPADQFTYPPAGVPGPVVTAVTPPDGAAAGGDTVTITGAGFTGVTGVRFGAAAAPAVTVNSDVHITAVSPAGTGIVDVTVTTPAGTSATSPADQFTYPPAGVPRPVVSAVAPPSGSAAGGDPVTITGAGFTAATGVRFGAVSAPAMAVNSDSQITALSPAAAGIVDVTVTTPAGTSATSPADLFTYPPGAGGPVVTAVTPPSGSAAGGDPVTITGAGFTAATGVRFGAAAAPAMTVKSDSQITAASPPGAGPVDVTVTTPAGTSATSPAGQFTYL